MIEDDAAELVTVCNPTPFSAIWVSNNLRASIVYSLCWTLVQRKRRDSQRRDRLGILPNRIHDKNSHLKKVSQYLRSKNWDTRVATAYAIGAIAQNVKHTSLADLLSSVVAKMTGAGVSAIVKDLVASSKLHSKIVAGVPFRSFDINKVLEFGAFLASSGQAMDRAHRLGQRKVVNVHRLIMRGTLEEKVMSLQRFKVSVANAVINAENASLKNMNTDQLLDLFASAETSKKLLFLLQTFLHVIAL